MTQYNGVFWELGSDSSIVVRCTYCSRTILNDHRIGDE